MKDIHPIIMILLCIFLPPIAVLIKAGAGVQLLLNVVLCLLFFLPGQIHALYVVFKG